MKYRARIKRRHHRYIQSQVCVRACVVECYTKRTHMQKHSLTPLLIHTRANRTTLTQRTHAHTHTQKVALTCPRSVPGCSPSWLWRDRRSAGVLCMRSSSAVKLWRGAWTKLVGQDCRRYNEEVSGKTVATSTPTVVKQPSHTHTHTLTLPCVTTLSHSLTCPPQK